MIDLDKIQVEQGEWQADNFGYTERDLKMMCTIGVSEEAGELSHAVLKNIQGIRGYDDHEKAVAEIKDAIGDICIFAMGVCNQYGISFEDCIRDVWNDVVRKRDWRKERVR